MVKHIMPGLKSDELGSFISSQLKCAGIHEEIFNQSAIGGIYAITNGSPRLVF